MKFIIIFFFLIFSTSLVSGTVVDFSERYQDYQGTWHKYTESNVHDYPMYSQIINGSKWDFTTLKDIISIPTTFDLTLSDTKISPSMTFPKTQLVSRMINYNATVAYLVFPYSLSRVKDWSDEHNIKLGRWKFDTAITIYDNNATPNYLNQSAYDFKIVDDEIRLYFIISEANKLIGNITVQMNSWTIDNATTSGFTSANVSLNGSRWTDSGQLAINHKNDAALNISGLVAYWSMDENTGTIVHQVNTESGVVNTTNQGTWNGNTTLNYSTGVIGNALQFDGVDDYVNAGNDASLNITSSFSATAWIKPTVGSDSGIISKDGISGNRGRYLLLMADGTLRSLISSNGTLITYFATTKIVNSSVWQHVATVYDASAQTLKVYINGVDESGTLTGTIPASINVCTISNRIGSRSTSYLNGSIDEVRIYNRALSQLEIKRLYNLTKHKYI